MADLHPGTIHHDTHHGAQQTGRGYLDKRKGNSITACYYGDGVTHESIKPLTDHLAALPDHELLQLFEALEVGAGALEYSDCQEEKLVKDFLLAMWRVTRWRTITKETA